MKFEYLKISCLAILAAVSVGLTGCCSDGCALGKCGLLGGKRAVPAAAACGDCGECSSCVSGTTISSHEVLDQYRGEVVGSSTRTADASHGSATKSCGTG